jgi:hypothetical protein
MPKKISHAMILMITLLVIPLMSQNTSGTLVGTVYDSASGDPIQNALVLLSQSAGPIRQVDSLYTDVNGDYLFDSIAFNQMHTLSVSANNYEPQSITNLIFTNQTPADTVDFYLIGIDTTNSWLVYGTITADSTGGTPIESVMVVFTERRGTTENRYPAATDANGNYALYVPALPLTYTVTASRTGYFSKEVQSQVNCDSTAVDMFLDTDTSAGIARGAVKSAAGELLSIFPNPLNDAAVVSFSVSQTQPVHLAVYGIDGRMVATLIDGTRHPGRHTAGWNAERVPCGVYFVNYRAGNQTVVQKLTLRK